MKEKHCRHYNRQCFFISCSFTQHEYLTVRLSALLMILLVQIDHRFSGNCHGKYMAAHTVGGRGIETVIAKESLGSIGGQDLSIKEHTYPVGIFCAKLHIMGYHNNRDVPFL